MRFYNAVDLVNQLEREKQQGKSGNPARQPVQTDAVILDELGYTNGHLHRPTWAQSRMPIDLIVSGNAMSLFHASHAASMMAS